MRSSLTHCVLALTALTSLGTWSSPAAAYQWTGPALLSAGNNTNGCSIRVPTATHSGSLGLSNIFITFQNRGTKAVRVSSTAELSGNNSRKSGSVREAIIQPGQSTSAQAFPPGGSDLANTVLRVTITACVPHTGS